VPRRCWGCSTRGHWCYEGSVDDLKQHAQAVTGDLEQQTTGEENQMQARRRRQERGEMLR